MRIILNPNFDEQMLRRRLRVGAAALVLLLVPAVAQAQRGVVSGTVRSAATAEPLEGARIEVVEVGRRSVTDEHGGYRVGGLAGGEYTVRASVPGRAAATARVHLAAGAEAVVDLELQSAPYELEAVTVLLDRTRMVDGRLTPVPGSAHYLGVESLRGAGRLIDDVHAVLRSVPGVNVQEEDGFGLRPNIGMRGTGVERSSKVSLMEDGVPIAPAPYAAPAAYVFPVLGRMDAVEVRKGSSQVKYGPWTTGGAINLVTTPIPSSLRVEADASGGAHGTRKLRATAGDSRGTVGWLLETYQLGTDGFKRLDGGAPTGFDLRDWFGKLRLSTAAAARVPHELELKLTLTEERSNETYLGLTEADFRSTPLRRYAASQADVMNVSQRKAALRHFTRPTGSIDVTTTVYHHWFSRDWYKVENVAGRSLAAVLSDPAMFAAELGILRGEDSDADALLVRANARSYVSRGVQTVFGARFGTGIRHMVELGVRLHEDSEDRFQHEDAYRMQGGRMQLTRAGEPGSHANRLNAARALAVFVDDRISAGPWTFSPGLRLESIRFRRSDFAAGDDVRTAPVAVVENGVDVLIPGIGAVRRLGSSLTTFAGVHRGFGPPGPGADDQARAEQSMSYELGLRYHTSATNAQLVGFWNEYTNILGRATVAAGESGSGDLFNGGAVRARGVEAAVDHTALSGGAVRVPLRLVYTFTDARFLSDFESSYDAWGRVVRGDRLPYLPVHQFQLGGALEGRGWAARTTATYTGAMRTRAGQGPLPSGEGTDRHLVIGTAAELAVAPGARLHAAVQNVTDARYVVARRPAGARPGLPRTVSLGLRIEHR